MSYVVHQNKPTNMATIHVRGACGHQQTPGTVIGNSSWSEEFASLQAAERFADRTGRQVRSCKKCDRNS